MLLHVLCFKNIVINVFTTPNFVDIEPDKAATQLGRSLALNIKDDYDKVKPYENLALFHIADFDDVTGVITPLKDPVLLLNCFDLIMQLKAQVSVKEDVDDVKQTNCN